MKELFGQRLREQRLKHHLTLEQVAEKADLSANYIGMVERGCSATSFLRNWDSILEKKRANLRSISEPARLRQPPPQKHGSGTRKRAGSKHTGGATNSRPSRAFCPLVG